jgi:hypothetical protein
MLKCTPRCTSRGQYRDLEFRKGVIDVTVLVVDLMIMAEALSQVKPSCGHRNDARFTYKHDPYAD